MMDNLVIKHLFFEQEDYERIIKVIGGRKDHEELLNVDAILLSTNAKADVIMEYIKKPFHHLSVKSDN